MSEIDEELKLEDVRIINENKGDNFVEMDIYVNQERSFSTVKIQDNHNQGVCNNNLSTI
jgi:hypothetical protein